METPYQRLEKIGHGAFSTVYKGVHLETKKLVAIKVLNLEIQDEEEVADIRSEITLLTQLKQTSAQNVTQYFGSYLNGSKLWVIMDYCQGGSVRRLLDHLGRIEERYSAVILRETLLALAYIHKAGIIHRDIKAANILLANNGSIQLCDFGVSTTLAANHLKRNTLVGTPYWMAPEVITEGSSYNFKADIWSLGVTAYEIATGKPPHADQEPMRAIFLIPRTQPPRLDGSQHSPLIKEFVSVCMQIQPDPRPTAEDLAKSRFIKGVGKVPTTTLRDLIIRLARSQEGGARQSMAMMLDKRGSLASNDENELDINDDIVGWDFDMSVLNAIIEKPLPSIGKNDSDDSTLTVDAINSFLFSGSLSANQLSKDSPPQEIARAGGEHPLEQLFNDDTVKTSHVPLFVPSRRRPTLPSRSTSPMPPVNLSSTQLSSPNSELRPSPNSERGEFDIRLSEFQGSGPIQIEIPPPENTVRRDTFRPIASRSRSNTVISTTRPYRSDSEGQTTLAPFKGGRLESLPPSPPKLPASRTASPKPQPPLPNPLSVQSINASAKSTPAPVSPPKTSPVSATFMPTVPPKSPLKGLHMPSKSAPHNPPLSPIETSPIGSPASNTHQLHKARSVEFKPTKPLNLTLKLPPVPSLADLNSANYLPPSPSRPSPIIIPHQHDMPPVISTPSISHIPPSPANVDLYAIPPLIPLNLGVLTEEQPAGSGAGTLLTQELERILSGFARILDVVGEGLTILESGNNTDGENRLNNGIYSWDVDDDFEQLEEERVGEDILDTMTIVPVSSGGEKKG